MQLYYTSRDLAEQAGLLCQAVADFKPQPGSGESDCLHLLLATDGLWIYSQQFKPLNLKSFYAALSPILTYPFKSQLEC